MLYCECGVMYVCCGYNESLIAICMCDFVETMILFSVVFLVGFLPMLVAGAMSLKKGA